MTYLAGLSQLPGILKFKGNVFKCKQFELTADIYDDTLPFLHFYMDEDDWSVSFFKKGMAAFAVFLEEMNKQGYQYVFAMVIEDKLKWERMIGMEPLCKFNDKYLVGRATDGN